MPFIGEDWRGPGEDWVKSEDGWEIRKINVMARGQEKKRDGAKRRRTKTEGDKVDENAVAIDVGNAVIRLERHRSLPSLQPFCPIVTKCTREVVGFNSLADVLKRLDFRSAVHDIRRFQYVAAILRHLLVPDRFYQLSGASQIFIFRLLEEMANTVYESQTNEHILLKFLTDLHAMLDDKTVWGGHLGSETLIRKHKNTRTRIACITVVEKRRNELELKKMKDDTTIDQLPEECVREILCKLSDHRDVENAGRTTPTMKYIVSEKRIWRELVQAHFTAAEVQFVLSKKPELKENKNCRKLYLELRKHFGVKPQYSELIMLCKNCRCVFWSSYGHPCLAQQDSADDICDTPLPLTPTTFLSFFNI